jgi:hypothetical protein
MTVPPAARRARLLLQGRDEAGGGRLGWGSAALSLQKQRHRICSRTWYKVDARRRKAKCGRALWLAGGAELPPQEEQQHKRHDADAREEGERAAVVRRAVAPLVGVEARPLHKTDSTITYCCSRCCMLE